MNNEHRIKLLLKLRALRTVLLAAIKRIENATQGVNQRWREKTVDNLTQTLGVIERNIDALQQLPDILGEKTVAPSGTREYTEMQSIEEYRKFQGLPPITQNDIISVDWKDLLGKL
jgi:hypothetical protein